MTKKIKLSPRGSKCTFVPIGFKGKACLKATAPYEKALSLNGPERTETPEMHQDEQQLDEGPQESEQEYE